MNIEKKRRDDDGLSWEGMKWGRHKGLWRGAGADIAEQGCEFAKSRCDWMWICRFSISICINAEWIVFGDGDD